MSPHDRPDLVARLLALPLKARRRLCKGAGWWIHNSGHVCSVSDAHVGGDESAMRDDAWAFWPADSVTWMEAACPEGGRWDIGPGRAHITTHPPYPEEILDFHAPNPISCALSALEKTHA